MPDRPNLLFFFPDQHRHDFVGFGTDVPVETPNLDRLAERGVAFENAVCPSPLCGPSRACVASGMTYERNYVRNHSADYPLAARTYYERLRDDAGYHVLGCGKFDLQKHSGDWGLDGTTRLGANGFSDGVNNAGKWDAFGSAADWSVAGETADAGNGRGRNESAGGATFVEANDPYMAYLDDHGLAQDHVEDFYRRKWDTGESGTDVDATFPTSLPEHAYCDNWIARRGLDLLADAPDDRPWHLVVNFAGPHNPWDVTEEMHGWYRDPDVDFPCPVDTDDADGDALGDRFEPETHQEVRRNYAAMVENIDRWVGRYLDRLEERGKLDDTVVVYASDHGEMLGDHGQWYKRSPYQPSVGVPLVVAGPGVESRGIVDDPATVLDLHATFLEYAGVDPGPVDSQSMRPYLEGRTDGHRDVVYSGIGPWRMAFDGRYKLVRGYDPSRTANEQVAAFDAWSEGDVADALENRDPLLFDTETDPAETENVAGANQSVVGRLSSHVEARRRGE
jgi:arylsulfatase A-like enzyme